VEEQYQLLVGHLEEEQGSLSAQMWELMRSQLLVGHWLMEIIMLQFRQIRDRVEWEEEQDLDQLLDKELVRLMLVLVLDLLLKILTHHSLVS
jgi:hypothetical protein